MYKYTTVQVASTSLICLRLACSFAMVENVIRMLFVVQNVVLSLSMQRLQCPVLDGSSFNDCTVASDDFLIGFFIVLPGQLPIKMEIKGSLILQYELMSTSQL